MRLGSCEVDRTRRQATANGKRLDLTPKEFQLLEFFMLRAGDVIRRTALLEEVWGIQFDPESNLVDVHVGNVRRKLRQHVADPKIVTARGVGFCLRLEGVIDPGR